MDLFDKLKNGAQGVAQNSKDFIETTRINSLISDENKKISALYVQIGELYYKTVLPDEETPIGKLCLDVTAANERIDEHKNEIQRIKELANERAVKQQVPTFSAPDSRQCPNCRAYITV